MLGFGLGLNASINFPGLLNHAVRPAWDFLIARTSAKITGRPGAPTFSITKISADGATIKRG